MEYLINVCMHLVCRPNVSIFKLFSVPVSRKFQNLELHSCKLKQMLSSTISLNSVRESCTLKWENFVEPTMVNYPMMPSACFGNGDYLQNTKLSLGKIIWWHVEAFWSGVPKDPIFCKIIWFFSNSIFPPCFATHVSGLYLSSKHTFISYHALHTDDWQAMVFHSSFKLLIPSFIIISLARLFFISLIDLTK